ncbi:energy transducer TonB [Ferruginibacter sp. SUN106]|uniref:energy transducer TonB n=1 Tax=Ferruginibacter sp. SUN106 TaxID=2978348 RepID=UPI003D3651DB
MKPLLLMLLCLGGIIYVHGQVVVEFNKPKKRSNAIVTVQVNGTSANDSALLSSLQRNIDAAKVMGKGVKKGKYIVVVKYIISKDGSISDITCDNDPGYGLCQEVIRVMKKTKTWTPAAQNGRTVHDYRH